MGERLKVSAQVGGPMADMQTTFVMIKPDGVQRNLVGEIVGRLEAKGLQLVGMRFQKVSEELAAQHYGVHKERPFHLDLVSFITSGPVVAMAWHGLDAISTVRTVVGGTDPREAAPGTIRGDFGMDIGRNLIHASDAPGTAEFELGLWFPDGVTEWAPGRDAWTHGQ